MQKAVITVIITAMCIISGCAEAFTLSPDGRDTGTSPVITERPAETSAPTVTDTKEESGGLTDLELKEMALADDAISALVESEAFQSASKEERAEMSLALLNSLAEKGAGDLKYPLIKKSSIYYAGGDMITFKYSCGVLGGIMITPFDPMMN